jgi:hypothetical protein
VWTGFVWLKGYCKHDNEILSSLIGNFLNSAVSVSFSRRALLNWHICVYVCMHVRENFIVVVVNLKK